MKEAQSPCQPKLMSTPFPISQREHTVTLNEDLTTTQTVVLPGTPQTEEYDGYRLITSGAEWKIRSEIDFSRYNFTGTGAGLMAYLRDEDKGHRYYKHFEKDQVDYYLVTYEDHSEVYTQTDKATAEATSALGAMIVADTESDRLLVYYQEMEFSMSCDYSSVIGKSGAFLNVSFHTSLPAYFWAAVSETPNSNEEGNIIFHQNIVPRQTEDGSFVGVAKFTVPYITPGEYFINFISGGVCLQSIPFTIEEGKDPYNDQFHLHLAGDWDYIDSPTYRQDMIDLFYSVYPRLIARWGNGTEPKTILFHADCTYDGVAYAVDTQVAVSTNYASENPYDIGFFSHELTHSIQQYDFKYGDDAWWTENHATYGGFRYFHWTNTNYIQICNKSNPHNFFWPNEAGTTYGPYGDGCKWFFSYMDYYWPTTQDENGNRKNGLIDTIHFEIKNGRLTGGEDNPYDKTNVFNQIVKEITGYDCMEEIRAKYEAEFKSGAWDFKGFADYEGNFITENLPNVKNPVYPMLVDKKPGDKTAPKLDTPVTEGENLALGATIPMVSGFTNREEAAEMLVDGDLTTKWCSTSGSAGNKTYCLDGTQQWIVLDLGEEKTFNTYTIYNTQTQETGGNTTEWEILLSNDAENWVSVDYQPDCNENIASFYIGDCTARYLLFKGYIVDDGDGTVRLYEFQLYKQ